jgi:DNA-binding response OmpR family regulator
VDVIVREPGRHQVSGTGELQLDMAQMVGATKTLTKPVSPEDLLAAVDLVLGERTSDPGTDPPT